MLSIQAIKDNPWKSTIGALGSAGTIITVVGALFTVDARYAHAADVDKAISQTQRYIADSNLSLRRQMLEDKVFEIDIRKSPKTGQLTPIDKALRDRYQQQINDLVRSQVQIQQQAQSANK